MCYVVMLRIITLVLPCGVVECWFSLQEDVVLSLVYASCTGQNKLGIKL